MYIGMYYGYSYGYIGACHSYDYERAHGHSMSTFLLCVPYMLLPPVAQLLTNVHYCSPVPSHIH